MDASKENKADTQRSPLPLHESNADGEKSSTNQQQKVPAMSQAPSTANSDLLYKKRANIDSNPSTSSTEVVCQLQDQKRLKPSQIFPSTIIQICTSLSARAFEGDILVTYGPALAKDSDSSSKAQIAHVDLVDRLGQTTITANVTNKQIQTHLPKLLPGSSVRLSDFTIRKRGQFERGDAEYCILITASTSIQTIGKVCSHRKLMPNTTISRLVQSTNPYPFGTLAVLVAGHYQSGSEIQLHIKDGENIYDTAMVTVSDSHVVAFTTLKKILALSRTPLLLLKNVFRSGPVGSTLIRSTPSTFIDPLNDARQKASLQDLASCCTQISGILKPKNAYLPPYQLLCTTCNHSAISSELPATNVGSCLTCAKDTTFAYRPSLQCIVESDEGVANCIMNGKLLEQHFPELAKVPFHNYEKDMSTVVHLLLTFEIYGTFTIAMDDTIQSIAKEVNNDL